MAHSYGKTEHVRKALNFYENQIFLLSRNARARAVENGQQRNIVVLFLDEVLAEEHARTLAAIRTA
jgi:hypothetical protein